MKLKDGVIAWCDPLNRLAEARQAVVASLAGWVEQEVWDAAVMDAGNLSAWKRDCLGQVSGASKARSTRRITAAKRS